MALINVFKNKKNEDGEVKGKKEALKNEVATGSVRKSADYYKILKSPHITEKATFLSEVNKYVFKAFPRANKIEIKKAIENIYNVKVKSVNIVNIHRKEKRLGRKIGFKTGYKKAIVSLKEGYKIEVMPR